jgi:hypothetical protein
MTLEGPCIFVIPEPSPDTIQNMLEKIHNIPGTIAGNHAQNVHKIPSLTSMHLAAVRTRERGHPSHMATYPHGKGWS